MLVSSNLAEISPSRLSLQGLATASTLNFEKISGSDSCKSKRSGERPSHQIDRDTLSNVNAHSVGINYFKPASELSGLAALFNVASSRGSASASE